MAEYTTPFFGDRDMGAYAPPPLISTNYFEKRNRADVRQVNAQGQVYAGDILTQHTYNAFNQYDMSGNNRLYQCTLKGLETEPACIFAIPSTYGNNQYTEEGQRYQRWAGAINEFNDMRTYIYLLVVKKTTQAITVYHENEVPDTVSGTKYKWRVVSSESKRYNTAAEWSYPDLITDFIGNGESVVVESYTQDVEIFNGTRVKNIKVFPDDLEALNANSVVGVKWYSVSQEIGLVPAGVIASFRTGLSHWADRSDSVINNIYCTDLNHLNPTLLSYRYIGTYIASGLPIFTLENMEQMVKYFQGESYLADNDTPPPSDWSTDWDIYVRGAQRPDIYITMKSDKLDDWLTDNAENTMGLTKKQVKVEYRYRYKSSVGDNDLDSGKVVMWEKDDYNKQRDTSYSEIVALNHDDAGKINWGEFSDLTIAELMTVYARLEFRIHYDKWKSTWCRFQIGVIGSPSVPDFEKMQNVGEQADDWQDESTVTLHYDEYPDGYNPYPTPPNPPSPTPKPTDPSPSINGTGLLTTTYKITDAQAKALGRFLWGGDFWQQLKALNMSPIENVVGLCYMPINIQGNPSVITIGNVDTNINGDVIGVTTPLYTLGSVNLQGRYKSFLDYSPYTTAHIFLPFVGFKPIDPQVFTGKTLSVVYSYDVITGVCNAMLFANGVYIESHQGNCGIDIPLVASNRAEVMAGLVMSLAKTSVTPASPKSNVALDVLGMSTDVVNAVSSFHSNRQGGYSPACAWSETRECYIVLETPNVFYPTTYDHDYGRPCMASYNIGQLSGFTVCDQTIDVSGIGRASEAEKKEIREILTSGFYA